jgi:hypothetical protein
MAPNGTSSARPANLMKYSTTMTQWDENTQKLLGSVQKAVDAWTSAKAPHYAEPGPSQDALLILQSSLKTWWSKDDWVAKVAVAFVDADKGVCTPVDGTAQDYATAINMSKVVKAPTSLVGGYVTDEDKYTKDYSDLSLADQLAEQARNAKTPEALKEILSQLPYGDPNGREFVAEFYNKLGAQEILELAKQLHGDDGGLRLLDESLAVATNSPTFDTKIITDLGAILDHNNCYDDRKAFNDLLRYGVYSERWLGMTAYEDWYKWGNYPDPVVFEALARNPGAAADILGQQVMYVDGAGQEHTIYPLDRIFVDLKNAHDLDDGSLDGPAAALIKAAADGDGFSAMRCRDELTWLGSQGVFDDIPNNVRKSIADVAAHHISEIAQDPNGYQFLLHLTKGHDDVAIELAKAAIADYEKTFPKFPPGTSMAEKQKEITTWAENQGSSLSLLLKALKENGMEDAENKTRKWEWEWFAGELFVNGVLTAVAPEAEVEAQIAKWGAEIGIDGTKEALFEKLEQEAKPDFAGTALEKYSENAREIMTEQIKETVLLMYLNGEVGTAPKGENPDEFLKGIVEQYVESYKPGHAEDFQSYLEKQGLSTDQINLLRAGLDGIISHDDDTLGGE